MPTLPEKLKRLLDGAPIEEFTPEVFEIILKELEVFDNNPELVPIIKDFIYNAYINGPPTLREYLSRTLPRHGCPAPCVPHAHRPPPHLMPHAHRLPPHLMPHAYIPLPPSMPHAHRPPPPSMPYAHRPPPPCVPYAHRPPPSMPYACTPFPHSMSQPGGLYSRHFYPPTQQPIGSNSSKVAKLESQVQRLTRKLEQLSTRVNGEAPPHKQIPPTHRHPTTILQPNPERRTSLMEEGLKRTQLEDLDRKETDEREVQVERERKKREAQAERERQEREAQAERERQEREAQAERERQEREAQAERERQEEEKEQRRKAKEAKRRKWEEQRIKAEEDRKQKEKAEDAQRQAKKERQRDDARRRNEEARAKQEKIAKAREEARKRREEEDRREEEEKESHALQEPGAEPDPDKPRRKTRKKKKKKKPQQSKATPTISEEEEECDERSLTFDSNTPKGAIYGQAAICAIKSGLLCLVAELVRAGADLMQRDKEGLSVKQVAAVVDADHYKRMLNLTPTQILYGKTKHGSYEQDKKTNNEQDKKTNKRVFGQALMFAIQHEDPVDVLLVHDADLRTRDQNGRTALTHMCMKSRSSQYKIDNRALLEHLIQSTPKQSINLQDDNGRTALWYAAKREDPLLVARLLEAGANPNLGTPLVASAGGGLKKCTELLLEAGAKPNTPDHGFKQTPLTATIEKCCPSPSLRQNHLTILKLLLENGADPNKSDSKGQRPLISAIKLGCAEFVEPLLTAGVDPNASDHELTPLTAVLETRRCRFTKREEDLTILKLLLENGADPNQLDPRKKLPLIIAAQDGDTEAVRLLLEIGKVDPFISVGLPQYTPATIAALNGNTRLVNFFLSLPPQECVESIEQRLVIAKVFQGNTRIDVTSSFNPDDLFKLTPIIALLHQSWSPEQEARLGKVPVPYLNTPMAGRLMLVTAAYLSNANACELLYKRGADPNASDNKLKATALTAVFIRIQELSRGLTCFQGPRHLEDSAEELIKGGFVTEEEQELALRLECSLTLKTLLKFERTNPNQQDATGRLPLVLAAQLADEKSVRKLLKKGADPNTFDKVAHESPITSLLELRGKNIHKSNYGIEVLNILLSSGANPNLMDPNGRLPLLIAVEKENVIAVVILLRAGAVPIACDRFGFSALEIAERIPHPTLIRILKVETPKFLRRAIQSTLTSPDEFTLKSICNAIRTSSIFLRGSEDCIKGVPVSPISVVPLRFVLQPDTFTLAVGHPYETMSFIQHPLTPQTFRDERIWVEEPLARMVIHELECINETQKRLAPDKEAYVTGEDNALMTKPIHAPTLSEVAAAVSIMQSHGMPVTIEWLEKFLREAESSDAPHVLINSGTKPLPEGDTRIIRFATGAQGNKPICVECVYDLLRILYTSVGKLYVVIVQTEAGYHALTGMKLPSVFNMPPQLPGFSREAPSASDAQRYTPIVAGSDEDTNEALIIPPEYKFEPRFSKVREEIFLKELGLIHKDILESTWNYKQVLLHLHPDKGGDIEELKRLLNIKEKLQQETELTTWTTVRMVHTALYRISVGARLVDTTVAAVRNYYNPTLSNSIRMFQSGLYTASIFSGINTYSVTATTMSVGYTLITTKDPMSALDHALKTYAFMLMPQAIMEIGLGPYATLAYTTSLTTYAVGSTASNLLSLCKELSSDNDGTLLQGCVKVANSVDAIKDWAGRTLEPVTKALDITENWVIDATKSVAFIVVSTLTASREISQLKASVSDENITSIQETLEEHINQKIPGQTIANEQHLLLEVF